jgi:uncharacterized protein (TIGR00251 family)
VGGRGELELTAVAGGTRLRLRVAPGARRDAIVGPHGGALKLSVTAPPERGKANRAVVELLAAALGVAAASVQLTAGTGSPDKTALLPLSPDEVRARLARACGGRG